MASIIPKVYTTVDDINYHLSNIFALYPTLYANHDNLSLYLQVIAPLIKNSREFCEAIKNKKLRIGSFTGAGGFSAAGPLDIHSDSENKKPMASCISFGQDGSWTSYFMETFSKTSHEEKTLYIKSVMKQDQNIIISSDPVHEGIVGALASHLFDIGVAPSFMKYMGLYICDDSYKVETEENAPVNNKIMGKPYFIFEKSDIEMYNFLGGELDDERKVSSTFAQTNPYDFMIWHTQLAHSQFVGKYYFGITHIDAHSKNIMLTYVKNTGNAIKWEGKRPAPLVYGKIDLAKAEHYEYVMPFKVNTKGVIVDDSDPNGIEARIMMENNGLLPKEIDFGLTMANLSESVVARDQNIVFANEPSVYDMPVMGYSSITQETKGDIDYNFSALNIAYRIARAINNPDVGYQDQKNHYKNLWNGMLPFWKASLPSKFDPSTIDSGGTFIQAKKLNGKDDSRNIFGEFKSKRGSMGGFHMRSRTVGTTSDIREPLKKIWGYLVSNPMEGGISRFSISSDKKFAYLQISRNNKPMSLKTQSVFVPYYSDPRLSNLQKYIKYNFALWRGCIPKGKFLSQEEINFIAKKTDPNLVGKNAADFCSIISQEINKYDPNNKKKLSFFKNIVSRKTPIWDYTRGMLKSGITQYDLEASGFQRSRTTHTQLFTLRFNPSEIKMSKLANSENLTFNSDQRMTDRKPPTNPGDYMNMVNVHLIYITPPSEQTKGAFAVTVELGKDLYKSATERLQLAKSGVSVNGGYFIVQGNYDDPLNYFLSPKQQGKPIGYFYSEITPEFNGTTLPVPRAYQKDFATVYVTDKDTLKIERSTVFQDKHETENKIVLYALTDRSQATNYAVQRKVIKMKLDVSNILRPVTNQQNSTFFYKAAFECGPILIWNGKIEYTRTKMEKSMFHIDVFNDLPSSTLPNGSPNTKVNNMETYKVVSNAQNSKMYFNEPGEGNFPYGQRHSNSLMIHNVMCETNDGNTLFVFIEGRGFDAVGLDRAQLAELISRFNVKNAVSLDGGFSANAVLKRPNIDESGYYWLLNDPDKRGLSSTIHFGEM